MKKTSTIAVTSIVKNEDRWIWYAVMSVIKHVDNISIYDTGSTDKTVEVIRSIDNPKITLKQKEQIDSKGFVDLRQEQLEEINSDWVLILDGDEIYPEDTISSLINEIRNAPEHIETIALRFYNCVGDIYHYNPKGKYKILGNVGNLTIRAVRRNIQGLHYGGLYKEGTEGLLDSKGVLIQDRKSNIKLLNKYYFHMHSLCRSSTKCSTMRRDFANEYPTYSCGIGKRFDKKNSIPEVFYINRPRIVPAATEKLPEYLSIKNCISLFYHLKILRFQRENKF